MNINKVQEGSELTLIVDGRLDTTTAPQLEAVVKESVEGITKLVFDFSNLSYISSAGLRVLLGAQKVMNKQGSMEVAHPNATLMDVFEVTGFVDILTIIE